MKGRNEFGNSYSLPRLASAAIPVMAPSKRFMKWLAPGGRCALFAAAGIFLTAISPGRATTIAWTNTSGGNWSAAANWKPNQVPADGDTALITSNGTYTVLLDVSPTIASLT